MNHYDVVVAGGGPAGLAAALGARRAGMSVLVLEQHRPPLDKACGEGIMPAGLAALVELGVDLASLGGMRFVGVTFVDGDQRATASFHHGAGLGTRRPVLIAALSAEAEARGVTLVYESRLRGYGERASHLVIDTGQGYVEANYLIGADGLHSRIRKSLSQARPRRRHPRYGLVTHIVAPASDVVEVHFAGGAEAYVTPVATNLVGLALLTRGRPSSFDATLALWFPSLAERFAGLQRVDRPRGAGPFHQPVRRVARGRVALIGDAAGYFDPITGEGMSLAFRSAVLLSDVWRRHDSLEAYAHQHAWLRRVSDLPARLTLGLAQHRRLRHWLVAHLAEHPRISDHLLELTSGDRSLPDARRSPPTTPDRAPSAPDHGR